MIREAPLDLADWLGCRPTNDFVVAVETSGFSEAVITDSYGVAWRAASDLSREMAAGRGFALPPYDHHALLREGGSVWIRPGGGPVQLALARLFKHDEYDDSAQDYELAVVIGQRRAPIKFVVTTSGLLGRRQQQSMRRGVEEAVHVGICPYRDVRGQYLRTQEPSPVRLGDLLSPMLLALDAAGAGLAEAG